MSACLKNTLPRHTRHSMTSKEGILSLKMTPATNLMIEKKRLNYHKNLVKSIIFQAKFIWDKPNSLDSQRWHQVKKQHFPQS